MAYKCIEREYKNKDGNYISKFVCDSEADILDLPKCCAGSIAVVVTEGSPVYVVNASGEWKVI